MKKTQRGGARKGAGRKPETDPKVPVTTYFKESVVKFNGGMKKFKDKIYKQFEH